MTETFFGASLRRVEDEALLQQRARFVDDIAAAGALHMVVLRSPIAHGRITRLDVDEARLPGVLGVWSHREMDLSWPQVGGELPPRYVLAKDTVRFVGEPIAVVVADRPELALDALTYIDVDYELLPAVVTTGAALQPDASLLFEERGTNLVYDQSVGTGADVLSDADVIIRRTVRNQRVAPVPMEPRGLLAVPGDDGLLLWAGQQNPHKLQRVITEALDGPIELRVVVPPTGGGFGARSSVYPEDLICAWLANELGRPVRYVESRSENLATMVHGRDHVHRAALGATSDGRLVGLQAEIEANFGAYVDIQWHSLGLTSRMLSGCYRIPGIEARLMGVVTNTAPTGAYRGAGRPEASYLVERMMDGLAHELGIDPAELRRRNFIPPDEFPYDTGLGSVYDSGNYAATLDAAITLQSVATPDVRDDRLRGVGMASYVELSSGGSETATASVDGRGIVTVSTGISPTGQGHHTMLAQLAADQLGVDPTEVSVVLADTKEVRVGGGTAGSRSATIGGSAVTLASRVLSEELKRLAADKLEAAPEDIRLVGGRAVVAGTDRGFHLGELAEEAGGVIVVNETFESPNLHYPFGCHIVTVDVNPATGEVDIVDYVAVDDCGRVINPMMVEGQLHGGTLQGIGQALYEEVQYDDDGNLLSGNLLTYEIPAARHAPHLRARRTETPSPNTPGGTKGTGESGTTGATPAVVNAVAAALRQAGVTDEDLSMPLTPHRVWQALQGVPAS